MYRHCPYCKSIVSFRAILSPPPWRDEHIRCNRCEREISGYWKEFSLFTPFIVGIVILFCIPLLHFSWLTNIMIAVCLYLLVMLGAYFLIPFARLDEIIPEPLEAPIEEDSWETD